MAERKNTDFYIKKLRWLDCLAKDTRVDNMAFRVAGIVAQHLNRSTGDTFVGRETIAGLIPGRFGGKAAAIKSVTRAVAALERVGYLEVFRPRGRGNSNTYSICFPEKGTPVSPFQSKKGTSVSPFLTKENGTSGDIKRDFSLDKTGHPCPTNLIESNLIESNLIESNLIESNLGIAASQTASIVAAQQAFKGRSSLKRQNDFNQAELNDLVDLISRSLGVTREESWEMVIGVGDSAAVDHLRRRMRRGDLAIADLELLRLERRRDARA